MLLHIVALISVVLLVNTAVAETASSTSSAPAATYTVSVGADGLNFSPHELNASVGDIIEYRFYPQNHSVARAAFGIQPCIPNEDTGLDLVGFWSGFRPVALVLNNPPIFRVRVNDTEPIFYYCSAPFACQQGMIGVINPNATQTFAKQLNYTQNATLSLSPLEYFPAEVFPSRTTTATGATSTPTGAPASANTALPTDNSSHSSLGGGPIAGIAIGGFAVAVLAAALIYMCGRQKSVNEILRQSTIAPSNHNSYQPTSTGVTEAQYANMQKTPKTEQFSSGGYGVPGNETESYRSMSPPLDERAAMIGIQPMHFQQGGQGSTGLGVMSPGSPGYPSPMYLDNQAHEMENQQNAQMAAAGLRPYNPTENQGLHELPVPSRNPSDSGYPNTATSTKSRPFSYTDSEAGFHAEKKYDPRQ